MTAALGTLLLACGNPSLDDGPCSRTDPCGAGAVCDFTAPGGPVCIPADGDIDNDGIPNDKDFCNHQPGGEFDEDMDGLGDECDPCPIAPPRDTPDTDNDNVDAPCDPEPSIDGNEILLFDGFNGQDARWEASTPGAWRVQGGEMIVDLSDVMDQDFMTTTVIGKNSIAVEASFRVDRVEASASRHMVGVYAGDPRPAGVAEVTCYVTKADVAPSNELVVVETNAAAMNQMTSDAFNTAHLYRAGTYVTGNRAGCSVLKNGGPLGTVQANITPDQLSQIALTAHATSVRYQYILVVGR